MVALFCWLIDQAMLFARFVYPLLRSQPLWLIPYLIATVIIWGLLSLVIGKDQTDLLGSGVPQIEAILKGPAPDEVVASPVEKVRRCPPGNLPGPVLRSRRSLNPDGAAIGQGMGERLFHADREENKLLLSCGVAAGLAAAFSAPLAGTMFLL
ncbi:chloride channel protein [Limosilactobacillus fermentum]